MLLDCMASLIIVLELLHSRNEDIMPSVVLDCPGWVAQLLEHRPCTRRLQV